MAKKRFGRTSKRLTLRKKYKVERKVREHHRRLRREARRNPDARTRLRKDPGLPAWAGRDAFIRTLAAEHAAETQQRQRDSRRAAIARAHEHAVADAADGLPGAAAAPSQTRAAATAAAAAAAASAGGGRDRRVGEGEGEGEEDVHVAGVADASVRAYYREFRKLVETADVFLEVLDARDPLGCRCYSAERAIVQRDTTKRIVLVLNKTDLVPRGNVEKWVRYLRHEFPTVAFKCSTQTQRTHIGRRSAAPAGAAAGPAAAAASAGECVGADALMHLLKNYSRSGGRKTSVTVGVIGYPNVGKSSVINTLKRERAAAVGARPGVTRTTQEIRLDRHVRLLDCPGIIFAREASAADALRNSLDVDKLADPRAPAECVVARCDPAQLAQLFGVRAFSDAQQFLHLVALKQGKLKPGGVADLDAAARAVLRAWNSGKIPFFTQPPSDRDALLLESTLVADHTGASSMLAPPPTVVLPVHADAAQQQQQQQQMQQMHVQQMQM